MTRGIGGFIEWREININSTLFDRFAIVSKSLVIGLCVRGVSINVTPFRGRFALAFAFSGARGDLTASSVLQSGDSDLADKGLGLVVRVGCVVVEIVGELHSGEGVVEGDRLAVFADILKGRRCEEDILLVGSFGGGRVVETDRAVIVEGQDGLTIIIFFDAGHVGRHPHEELVGSFGPYVSPLVVVSPILRGAVEREFGICKLGRGVRTVGIGNSVECPIESRDVLGERGSAPCPGRVIDVIKGGDSLIQCQGGFTDLNSGQGVHLSVSLGGRAGRDRSDLEGDLLLADLSGGSELQLLFLTAGGQSQRRKQYH